MTGGSRANCLDGCRLNYVITWTILVLMSINAFFFNRKQVKDFSVGQMFYPNAYPGLFQRSNNSTTTLKELVANANQGKGCRGDYRNYPVAVQDLVNVHLGEAMMRLPNVSIEHDIPPTAQQLSTKDLCSKAPFTGVRKNSSINKPMILFEAYMFSHEIELLEARLYEGIGIVDRHFIGESAYTHRGHQKPKFASRLLESRFQKFTDIIQIVDLDADCPDYIDTILKYRKMVPRPVIIWDTQNAAQACLAQAVRDYAKVNAPDALVQVSDLDEMPFRSSLAAVKLCDFGTQFPVVFSTTHSAQGKLCRPPITQRIPGMLFKASEMTAKRRPEPGKAMLEIKGGVHMTYFGGSLVEFFKTSNHAEGGQMNTLGWLSAAYNPSVCDATKDDWYRREELLCTDTATVIQPWLKRSPPRREHPAVTVGNEHLPWVIAMNRQRYPCFFAAHKDCTDSYISIIM